LNSELQKLGGASVILATAPSGESMGALINGLGINCKMVVVGAEPTPFQVSPFQLLTGRKDIEGWPSVTAVDSEDTLNFRITNSPPMIETSPQENVSEAYKKVISN